MNKKQKKYLIISLVLLAVGFFIRPIRKSYSDNMGNSNLNSSDVTRVGLMGAKYNLDSRVTGKIGLFGKTITWDNGSIWTAN